MASNLEKLRIAFAHDHVLSQTGNKPLDAYILPSTDAHQGEYLADYDFRVRFLSDFSGSNAFVVVTASDALLWTDGRYFVQAEKQLKAPWKLMKQPGDITYEEFLAINLKNGSVVGFDPTLFKFDDGKRLTSHLEALGHHVFPIKGNLVDIFWTDRPSLGHNKVMVLEKNEHGKDASVKIAELRKTLTDKRCTAIILSQLDDIVWLLNIRGNDIPYNPLVYSYLFVTLDSVQFFVDQAKIDDKARKHLEEAKVQIHDYESAYDSISKWNSETGGPDDRILIPNSTNYQFGKIFKNKVAVIETSPVQISKSLKNPVELEGIRKSSVRDSVALVIFFQWLEKQWKLGKTYTEIQLAKVIDEIRSQEADFVEISFSTISASGDHAALPHYHSEGEDGKRIVEADNAFLLDSGGHYRDGTTDVTRTVWHKNPPKDFIINNTLVLKGHIDVALLKFPKNILGYRIDAFARHALWQYGLDFSHGTGHGVGHFLNVHEGPIGIGYRSIVGAGEIRAGNIITIEPGYYLPGHFGIRIENCYEVVETEVPSGSKNFVGFRALTLVPIQTSIIDKSMLCAEHIAWINAYHDRVLAEVGGELKWRGKNEEYEWLKAQCAHI